LMFAIINTTPKYIKKYLPPILWKITYKILKLNYLK